MKKRITKPDTVADNNDSPIAKAKRGLLPVTSSEIDVLAGRSVHNLPKAPMAAADDGADAMENHFFKPKTRLAPTFAKKRDAECSGFGVWALGLMALAEMRPDVPRCNITHNRLDLI